MMNQWGHVPIDSSFALIINIIHPTTLRHSLSILLFLLPFALSAQQMPDTLSHEMRDVEVKSYRIRSHIGGRPFEAMKWDMKMMEQMPQILSNADPVHYLQLLPSVQTNNECDAGLHVQGCSNAQSMMQIGDAPVYNPAHMLGFFSTFNASHYQSLLFRTFNEATTSNVLGGQMQMLPHTSQQDTLSGNLSVGLISSQGTIHVPMGHGQTLSMSARQTYINLLYGPFIKMDESEFHYRFGDFNLTYALHTPRHTLSIDAFYSNDKGKVGDGNVGLELDLRWQNYVVQAQLDSRPLRVADAVHQSLYYSGYQNRSHVAQANINGKMPSHINTLGYHLEAQRQLASDRRPLLVTWGADLLHHSILPQNPDFEGGYEVEIEPVSTQHALQAALFAQASMPLTQRLGLKAGVRLNVYSLLADSASTFFHPDPYVALTLDHPTAGHFQLRLNRQHQYVHQAGFSSVGLPTEFRFSASQLYKPQRAWSLTLGFDREVLNRQYRIKAEVYGKLLEHQLEYHGDFLSFFTSGYKMQSTIVSGKGYNYGVNVQIIKQTGRLTGWISYAYGRSMRRFDQLNPDSWYPSNYERPHELNAVATYRLNPRWSFGGTMAFASGTPFTAIKYVYMLSNVLVSQYGEHNANRLAPYFRFDVSANYDFRPRRRVRQGINLSLYNATGHHNDIYCRLKIYNGNFSYRPIAFLLPVLPSVSYYVRF